VRSVARHRDQDLLEKGLNVSGHEISEGRHRLHRPCEGCARHLGCTAWDLDQKPDRGSLCAKEGLHTRATFPTDRCHLNDTAVRVNRDHGNNTAIREEDMVKRTISVHENLRTSAWNVLKLWYEPLQIAGWQSEQKSIAGPT
jgi:hypothetical protein